VPRAEDEPLKRRYFGDWLREQAHRTDDVGELARKVQYKEQRFTRHSLSMWLILECRDVPDRVFSAVLSADAEWQKFRLRSR
jgi:hypothetical protein